MKFLLFDISVHYINSPFSIYVLQVNFRIKALIFSYKDIRFDLNLILHVLLFDVYIELCYRSYI